MFAEWKGKFRNYIWRFIKGNADMTGVFAKRICASKDPYDFVRCPFHTINFVTGHDDFTLLCLVSFDAKHNEIPLFPLFSRSLTDVHVVGINYAHA